MNAPKYAFIPDSYSEHLPQLKERAFQWQLDYCSRTENKTIGHITHYSIDPQPVENCLILIPGLASNTRTEPLMQVITYWALTNHHDVYCLDTFLGDFQPNISQELANKHTFTEYVDLIDTGLDRIETECKNKKYSYSCLIGHSAGATATFEIYNKRISQRKKLRFSASIMFAPYLDHSFTKYIKRYHLRRYAANGIHIPDDEFPKTVVSISSPHEPLINNQTPHLSILPQIYDDIDSVEFRPDLMDKYNIPITLVTGGRDKKSPPEELRKKFNILRQGQNGHLWKFVSFKDSRHSFIEQHKDYRAILRIIQSQKRFAQNCGK